MTAAPPLSLRPGAVYRTRALGRWSANAPRLAKRLVAAGELVPLAHGLYAAPRQSRFGPVPPADDALLRAFLDGAPFVLTGPDRWNALGLGTTALFAAPLVYNTKRSGVFDLGGRRFILRRIPFPRRPTPEWYAVDLLEHAGEAGTSREELVPALAAALRRGVLHRARLRSAAETYGTRATRAVVAEALGSAAR